MNAIVSDQEQRQTALDPSRSFIVQAPAGSGKTGLLVRRFLVLLALCNEPEEILAITFTRKATAEMLRRILNALASVHDHNIAKDTDPDILELAGRAFDRDQARKWNLLANPRRLRIQTIDSLSYEIVKSMPWSSRFGAAPSMVENIQAKLAYQEAAKRTLQRVDQNDRHSPFCAELLKLINADFDRAQELLAMMLDKRDYWMRGINFYDNTQEQFEQMWSRVIQHEIDIAAAAITDELKPQIARLARFAASNLESENPTHPLLGCLDLCRFPNANLAALNQWRGVAALLLTNEGELRKRVDTRIGFPAANKDEKRQINSILDSIRGETEIILALKRIPLLPNPKFSDQQWQALRSLLHLLPVAAADLKLIFMESNLADYSEISQRAEWALGDNDSPSDLAFAMDYQLSHLLMDEVQDTSRAQIVLLEKLTRGWQAGDGRTLFFVGDPMQSIYRFRQADVGNFLNIQKFGIADIIPEQLILVSNFRSDGNLVAWHNRVFSHIFPAIDNAANAAVRYSPSRAVGSNEPGHGVQIHAVLEGTDRDEAVAIAEQLTKELESQSDATFGILGRTRKHLVEIASELRSRQISFQAVELEKMSLRPAIQDLMALTRSLLQPSDRIAWLSLLRAPWCGLDLKDISVVAMNDHDNTILELASDPYITNNMSDCGQARLAMLLKHLSVPLTLRGRVSLRHNVHTAWLLLGGPACVDPGDLDDCERYLQMLETVENENDQITPDTLNTAVHSLWSHYDNESQVQLLTIHKSKGLEFDIVFLPQLQRKIRQQEQTLLRWSRVQDGLLVAALSHSDARDDDKFNIFLRALEKQKQINEDYRLLYVACTRAKKKLHLFMALQKDAKASNDQQDVISAPVSGSLSSLLWPALEAEIVANYSIPKAQPAIDQSGLPLTEFYRLPLGWTAPDCAHGLTAKPQSLKSISEEMNEIEFSWAGETMRITGITIHRMLQQINPGNWAEWKSKDTGALLTQYWALLIENRLTGDHLRRARGHLALAIEHLKTDPRVDWLFSDQHRERQSEWPLTGMLDGAVNNIIIDHSFIDKTGIRWIIDFKSSRHEGGDLEKFIIQEKGRYRQQLERYAKIVRLLEGNKIMVGLYFPLHKGWCEWAPEV